MRRILTPSVLVFLVTFTACLLAACSLAADITPPPNYQPPTNLESQAEVSNGPVYPLVSPDIAAGAGIYAEKCAPCHGPTGMGDGFRASEIPDVPALGKAEVARQSTPADWYSIVTEGNLERLMPPFTSLSDRERWDVVAYAYTLSMAEETISRGNELSRKTVPPATEKRVRATAPRQPAWAFHCPTSPTWLTRLACLHKLFMMPSAMECLPPCQLMRINCLRMSAGF